MIKKEKKNGSVSKVTNTEREYDSKYWKGKADIIGREHKSINELLELSL